MAAPFRGAHGQRARDFGMLGVISAHWVRTTPAQDQGMYPGFARKSRAADKYQEEHS
jgi:hypothetical protein